MHGLTPLQRFMRYVVIPAEQAACWQWVGAKNDNGWGSFRLRPGAGGSMAAARASWVLHRGPIAAGMCVCHYCDNPLCVNPEHLWLGTVADNNRDCAAKGRNINPDARHMTPTKSGTRVHVRICGVLYTKHFPHGTPHNTMQRWLHETRATATA